MTLFAEDPDIVTPIGLTLDSSDRIFILESHTHTPPRGYSGPTGDVIKLSLDRDRDGHPDSISVFARDVQEGMTPTARRPYSLRADSDR